MRSRNQRSRYFALTRSTFVAPRMAANSCSIWKIPKPNTVARLELIEHVHVAVRAKIIPEHGAEHGQTPDMMPAAERGDLARWAWRSGRLAEQVPLWVVHTPILARIAPTGNDDSFGLPSARKNLTFPRVSRRCQTASITDDRVYAVYG